VEIGGVDESGASRIFRQQALGAIRSLVILSLFRLHLFSTHKMMVQYAATLAVFHEHVRKGLVNSCFSFLDT
jgi:hypothetical protein